MADFVSNFWKWYIFILVSASIIAVFALVYWMSGSTSKPGEKVKTMGHVWDEDLEELNNPLPLWWLNLFYITIGFAVVYLVLYPGSGIYGGLLHWTEVGEYHAAMKKANAEYGPLYDKYLHEDIKVLVTDPAAIQMGHRLFMTYCTNCHGSDARGGPGFPNLRDNDWLYGGAPDQIEASIKNGRGGTMPAWGPVLGPKGVADVAQYVLSFTGRETDHEAVERGKKTFAQFCFGCHGADAKGNQVIGAPNLTDNIWLNGGSLQTIIQTITYGRHGHMPAHGEFLGDAKIHLLAAYIYSLSHTSATQ
ncbi:MAG: cytochrome-c oxidase, cbb3-type subunit III [Acidiferrobacterales bacterium]